MRLNPVPEWMALETELKMCAGPLPTLQDSLAGRCHPYLANFEDLDPGNYSEIVHMSQTTAGEAVEGWSSSMRHEYRLHGWPNKSARNLKEASSKVR